MAVKHVLKCWPEPFKAIASGLKTHEIRKNDRSYASGDILVLHEWNPQTERYTGEVETVFVTYISEGGKFGLPLDLCVMSVRRGGVK